MSVRRETARKHRDRVRGFDDGYAGRRAASMTIDYQRAWRRGREARDAERGGAA